VIFIVIDIGVLGQKVWRPLACIKDLYQHVMGELRKTTKPVQQDSMTAEKETNDLQQTKQKR
jgi:hypothetical protein